MAKKIDIRKVLKDISKLSTGKSKEEQLRRIEALIVSIALLLLIAYVLKFFRWRAHSRFLNRILLFFDAISDSMVTYSIALMQQATPLDDSISETFSIWAVILLILGNKYCNDFDRSKVHRLRSLLAYLMNYFFAAFLNLSTKSNKVTIVVWILWLLPLCKLVLRSWIFELAYHSRNLQLIGHYKHKHELSQQQECDPATMYGYNYLVHGEGKSMLDSFDSDYPVKLEVGNEKKLITLEKIWSCKGRLLNINSDPDCKMKDLCLSFALYKLILRRFDDLPPPPAADQRKAHVLFHEALLSQGQDYRRVFRVIEIELAFLRDYFHTLLPAVLYTRYTVFYTLIFASFGMCLWLLMIIAEKHQHHFEFFITIVLVCVVILMGVIEVLNYACSDWIKLLLLWTYVKHHSWQGNALVEMLLQFLCSLKFFKHWHNKICQYHLLKSFCHDSILLRRRESTVRKFKTSVSEGPRVKVTEETKKAILDSLREQISTGRLRNGTVSLQRNQVDEKLSWACNMRTNVHTILVWHVATCFCEINMPQRHSVARRSVRNCFRPASFILDRRNLNGDKLQVNYIVASSLSKYCAYLLVFCPKLLRYHKLTINFILEKTAAEVRKILKDERARSISHMRDRLWDAADGADEGEESDNVMRMGARLGRTLVQDIVDVERIWKVLAEFWAEMVLYITQFVNKDAHKEHLNTGGEFLTHLWALLYHAGINEKDDDAPVP